jgi:hypothetical protein
MQRPAQLLLDQPHQLADAAQLLDGHRLEPDVEAAFALDHQRDMAH